MANDKGWMNQILMQERAKKCWRKRQNSIFQKKCLLIMDSMRMYVTDETKKCLGSEKTRLAIVPGGLTKKPLDLCINQAFKAHMHHHWELWMSAENHTFIK